MRCLFLLALLFPIFGLAQQASVSGIVVNDADAALEGVSVSVTGTRISTQTDDQGMFDLKVPSGKELLIEFTHTAYEPVRKKIFLQINQ